MDNKTVEALEKSIVHWRENLRATDIGSISTGVDDCALCGLFWVDICVGCPVQRKTGSTDCHESPYLAASVSLTRLNDDSSQENWEKWRKACKAEISFLEGLRDGCEIRSK